MVSRLQYTYDTLLVEGASDNLGSEDSPKVV